MCWGWLSLSFLVQETLRVHVLFLFYIDNYIEGACCKHIAYALWLPLPIVCVYQASESLAARLASDVVIVTESKLGMWSRWWSITWSLFRVLEKLSIYKTIKSQCWVIAACLLLHEFLEGDGFSAATDCGLSHRKQKAWSVSNALPLSLLICLYSFLDKRNFFSLTPWVFLFRYCWGRGPGSRSAMLGICQVDPICTFHRGSWTSSSREKIFSHYQSGLGVELLTKRQIFPFFLYLSGPRDGSQKVFESTVWECRSALTESADTVALLVLSKTLCSPRHHTLFYQKEEREGV